MTSSCLSIVAQFALHCTTQFRLCFKLSQIFAGESAVFFYCFPLASTLGFGVDPIKSPTSENKSLCAAQRDGEKIFTFTNKTKRLIFKTDFVQNKINLHWFFWTNNDKQQLGHKRTIGMTNKTSLSIYYFNNLLMDSSCVIYRFDLRWINSW